MGKALSFVLSRRAQDDYEDILRYTRLEWGEAQAERYDEAIHSAFQMITKNPKLGRSRDGLLIYPVVKHCIYYRVTKSTIHVVRILHERMDAHRHLQ